MTAHELVPGTLNILIGLDIPDRWRADAIENDLWSIGKFPHARGGGGAVAHTHTSLGEPAGDPCPLDVWPGYGRPRRWNAER